VRKPTRLVKDVFYKKGWMEVSIMPDFFVQKNQNLTVMIQLGKADCLVHRMSVDEAREVADALIAAADSLELEREENVRV